MSLIALGDNVGGDGPGRGEATVAGAAAEAAAEEGAEVGAAVAVGAAAGAGAEAGIAAAVEEPAYILSQKKIMVTEEVRFCVTCKHATVVGNNPPVAFVPVGPLRGDTVCRVDCAACCGRVVLPVELAILLLLAVSSAPSVETAAI